MKFEIPFNPSPHDLATGPPGTQRGGNTNAEKGRHHARTIPGHQDAFHDLPLGPKRDLTDHHQGSVHGCSLAHQARKVRIVATYCFEQLLRAASAFLKGLPPRQQANIRLAALDSDDPAVAAAKQLEFHPVGGVGATKVTFDADVGVRLLDELPSKNPVDGGPLAVSADHRFRVDHRFLGACRDASEIAALLIAIDAVNRNNAGTSHGLSSPLNCPPQQRGVKREAAQPKALLAERQLVTGARHRVQPKAPDLRGANTRNLAGDSKLIERLEGFAGYEFAAESLRRSGSLLHERNLDARLTQGNRGGAAGHSGADHEDTGFG